LPVRRVRVARIESAIVCNVAAWPVITGVIRFTTPLGLNLAIISTTFGVPRTALHGQRAHCRRHGFHVKGHGYAATVRSSLWQEVGEYTLSMTCNIRVLLLPCNPNLLFVVCARFRVCSARALVLWSARSWRSDDFGATWVQVLAAAPWSLRF